MADCRFRRQPQARHGERQAGARRHRAPRRSSMPIECRHPCLISARLVFAARPSSALPTAWRRGAAGCGCRSRLSSRSLPHARFTRCRANSSLTEHCTPRTASFLHGYSRLPPSSVAPGATASPLSWRCQKLPSYQSAPRDPITSRSSFFIFAAALYMLRASYAAAPA